MGDGDPAGGAGGVPRGVLYCAGGVGGREGYAGVGERCDELGRGLEVVGAGGACGGGVGGGWGRGVVVGGGGIGEVSGEEGGGRCGGRGGVRKDGGIEVEGGVVLGHRCHGSDEHKGLYTRGDGTAEKGNGSGPWR